MLSSIYFSVYVFLFVFIVLASIAILRDAYSRDKRFMNRDFNYFRYDKKTKYFWNLSGISFMLCIILFIIYRIIEMQL